MSTATEPEVETKPAAGDVPPCWPPVAHLIHNKDKPAKEGTLALCGAKLMGIDLGNLRNAGNTPICKACIEAFQRIYGA